MKTLAGRFHIAALQVVAVGKGYGVNQNVEITPFFLHQLGGLGNGCIIRHVALEQKVAAELFVDGLNPLLESFPGVAQRDGCAIVFEFLGNGVGDTLVVRHTENQGF